MTRLTPLQQAALAFVCANPGCTTGEVEAALGKPRGSARDLMGSLYVRRLVGRQKGLYHSGPNRYWPEAAAYEYVGVPR